MMQIQSTAIKDDFLTEIISRTISDIHDTIKTVFGPYATDAYIKKDDQLYYTRDGKEVLASIGYDNEIARNVRNMIYQAVHRQGTMVGDGTTTLAMLYTNLYDELVMSKDRFTSYNISHLRPVFKEVIKELNDRIKNYTTPLNYNDLKSLVYTCTQDPNLVDLFYSNLKEAILDEAYIVINKSDIDTEFEMTVHENPIIKADKQYSLMPFNDNGVVDNVSTYYCKGMLDISDPRTMLGLAAKRLQNQSGQIIPHTILILCHGVNEVTRKTLKEFTAIINDQVKCNPDFDFSSMTNIVIYTLRDYRKFDSEMFEDLVAYLYDVQGVGGIVNALTFESLMYQANVNPDIIGGKIENLETFDSDPADLQKLRDIFLDMHTISVDSIEGIRFGKPMGKISENRYKALREEIEAEKSPVKQLELRKRLKMLYGKFIEVEIGSKLLKDSQRTYELMLDAVLSSLEAVRYGALKCNSLLLAYKEADLMFKEYCKDSYNKYGYYDRNKFAGDIDKAELIFKIKCALEDTLNDMINNRDPETCLCDLIRYQPDYDVKCFNLKRKCIKDTLLVDYVDEKIKTPEGEIDPIIVEPVSVITTILENSTIALELATAKLMTTASPVMNFI